MRFLVRRRVVEADGDTLLLAEKLEQRDPALAQLAAAAVAGLPPAGPELRRKPLTVVLPAGCGPKMVRHLCVEDAGFVVHAASSTPRRQSLPAPVAPKDIDGLSTALEYWDAAERGHLRPDQSAGAHVLGAVPRSRSTPRTRPLR